MTMHKKAYNRLQNADSSVKKRKKHDSRLNRQMPTV